MEQSKTPVPQTDPTGMPLANMRTKLRAMGFAETAAGPGMEVRRVFAYVGLREFVTMLHTSFGVDWSTIAGLCEGIGDVIDSRTTEQCTPNFRDSFP